jgi:hypothetical protein
MACFRLAWRSSERTVQLGRRAKSVDLVSAGPSKDPRSQPNGRRFPGDGPYDAPRGHLMHRWIHGSHQHRQQPVGGWVGGAPTTLPIMPTAGRPGSTWPADGPRTRHGRFAVGGWVARPRRCRSCRQPGGPVARGPLMALGTATAGYAVK